MIYRWCRWVLFLMKPERSHQVTLRVLRLFLRPCVARWWRRRCLMKAPVTCMGLSLENPIGLAAGLDKNGDYVDQLLGLGFGFVEVGTVTPRAQDGNPKPRLFRLVSSKALINRMGFNNKGVDYLVSRLRTRTVPGCVGVNIGKNKDTPLASALNDYVYGVEAVYAVADYIVVNVSSPNTPGLRDLQDLSHLIGLLKGLSACRERCVLRTGVRRPLCLKVTVDCGLLALQSMAQALIDYGWDGMILSNTTVYKDAVAARRYANEEGGLSGAPLVEKVRPMIAPLLASVSGRLPIIVAGGVASAQYASNLFTLGVPLLQVYTGFIYEGPSVIRQLIQSAQRPMGIESESEGTVCS